MRQQFNLSLWLQDKSRKVVTRNGRSVTIVCPKSPYDTIVGFCGKDEYPDLWDLNGKFLQDRDSDFDLFFAEEEEGLTEFEKAVDNIINYPHFQDEQSVKQFSKTLLDLAREEIGKDVLKDLPELEKTKDVFDPTIPVMYTDAASMKTYVEYDGYKLCINDTFEKLPKGERGE